jgi:hypothetical protein
MMQEVLDAENEVSQATDDAVNMNIGNEESIEDENSTTLQICSSTFMNYTCLIVTVDVILHFNLFQKTGVSF